MILATRLRTKVTFSLPTELTEGELRALDALVGYGFDSFIKCFYTHLGKAYLEPYEKDLKQLFDKVESLRPAIAEIEHARKLLNAAKL